MRALTPGLREDGRAGLAGIGDVRLDNRDQLRAQLSAPAESDDFALVLRAYERWGDACAVRLVGDFAFCIASAQDRTLFCCRDVVGVKPLHLARTRGRVAVASSPAELAHLEGVEMALRDEFVARALAADFTSPELTPYRGVERLPPGHSISVDLATGRSVTRRYWTPPDVDPANRKRATADLAEELRELVTVAVRSRVDSERGTAVHLSGGLDSSTVSGIANRAAPQPLPSYWLQHAGSRAEEPFVRAAADHAETRHRTLDAGVVCCDDPGAHPRHAWPPFPGRRLDIRERLYCRLRQQGTPVLLSGYGGDQCASFAGLGFAAGLAVRGHWWRLLRAMRDARAVRGDRPLAFLRSDVAAYLVRPFRDRSVMRRYDRLVDRDFSERTGFGDLRGSRRFGPSAERNRRRWLADGHLARLLELQHWEAAPFGVEYRYPLLDRRVLEWCLTVPAERWVERGTRRMLFREAAAPFLPDIVRTRTTKLVASREGAEHVEREHALRLERLRAACADPVVTQFLPGVTPAAISSLDSHRAQHLDLTMEFLREHGRTVGAAAGAAGKAPAAPEPAAPEPAAPEPAAPEPAAPEPAAPEPAAR